MNQGFCLKKEILIACKLVEDSGAQFIKNSTGFSSLGATKEIIKLIKSSITSNIKIKASGGINMANSIQSLILSGADRIGTSSSLIIMKEIIDK